MIQSIKTTAAVLRTLAGDRRGVSALEYGVLAAIVIVAVAAAGATLSPVISGMFTSLGTKITSAITS